MTIDDARLIHYAKIAAEHLTARGLPIPDQPGIDDIDTATIFVNVAFIEEPIPVTAMKLNSGEYGIIHFPPDFKAMVGARLLTDEDLSHSD